MKAEIFHAEIIRFKKKFRLLETDKDKILLRVLSKLYLINRIKQATLIMLKLSHTFNTLIKC